MTKLWVAIQLAWHRWRLSRAVKSMEQFRVGSAMMHGRVDDLNRVEQRISYHQLMLKAYNAYD